MLLRYGRKLRRPTIIMQVIYYWNLDEVTAEKTSVWCRTASAEWIPLISNTTSWFSGLTGTGEKDLQLGRCTSDRTSGCLWFIIQWFLLTQWARQQV